MSRLSEIFWSRLVYIVAVGVVIIAIIRLQAPEVPDAPAPDGAANVLSGDRAPARSGPGESGREDTASARARTAAGGPDGGADTEGVSSDTVAATAAAGAAADFMPIPIPAEHTRAFERDDGLRQFHEMLERETEDLAWATGAERKLRDYLSESFDLSEFIIELVECRSASCEMLVTGYGDAAFRDWINGMAPLFESGELELWGGGPGRASCGGGDIGPGVFALNCTFTRTEAAPEDAGSAVPLSLDEPYPEGIVVERVSVPEILTAVIETKPEVYNLHRRLETEPADVGWSEFIETQIIEHFAALPELQSVTVLGVECRTTLCEVQMMMSDSSSFGDWLAEMMAFHDEPWHDLVTADLNGDDIDENRMAIVWLLERRPQN